MYMQFFWGGNYTLYSKYYHFYCIITHSLCTLERSFELTRAGGGVMVVTLHPFTSSVEEHPPPAEVRVGVRVGGRVETRFVLHPRTPAPPCRPAGGTVLQERSLLDHRDTCDGHRCVRPPRLHRGAAYTQRRFDFS